jgi:hypothetical protein
LLMAVAAALSVYLIIVCQAAVDPAA